MNTVGYFEIQANDLNRAIKFYSEVFDWKFIKDPNIPVDYWRIEGAGLFGGLLPRPAPVPPAPAGTNAFVNSIQVDNFDVMAKKILDRGGIVALEKFAVPGKCWQGYFQDTEGNTFGLFQVDAEAA